MALFTIKPVKHGISYNHDVESGYCWALFNRKDVPQNLIDMHLDKESDFDLAYRLTEWEAFAHGVGRSFAGDPYCKIGRNHILVKQFRGLDV